jgi:hypothetical protein
MRILRFALNLLDIVRYIWQVKSQDGKIVDTGKVMIVDR